VVGEGLLTSDGETWQNSRRALQPVFHRKYNDEYAAKMAPMIARAVECWGDYARSGKVFDVADEMMRLTLCNAGATLFDTDLDDQAERIGRDLSFALEYIHAGPLRPFSAVQRRRFRRAMRGLNLQIERVTSRRQEEIRNDEPVGNDLLQQLLSMKDGDGKALSSRQLHDEMMTFIFTGHETTAIALSWMWYLLARHPEVEARLHRETERVLDGRAPTLDDLPQMPYARMVFQETMRLYPPVWTIARRNLNEMEIDGHRIPADSIIMILPYITHRDPQFWPDPETFDPERFSPENSHNRPRYAYFPFGGGARQCIGQNLAMHEAMLVTASLVQRYRLQLAPGRVVEPMAAATLRPRHGIWMTAHQRT
jgi:cytochrome P450